MWEKALADPKYSIYEPLDFKVLYTSFPRCYGTDDYYNFACRLKNLQQNTAVFAPIRFGGIVIFVIRVKIVGIACSPLSDTVSHDIYDGFLCKQCVELVQFWQAIKLFWRIFEVERAIMTFWILENWEVCKFLLFISAARDSWKGNIVTLQSKMLYKGDC